MTQRRSFLVFILPNKNGDIMNILHIKRTLNLNKGAEGQSPELMLPF